MAEIIDLKKILVASLFTPGVRGRWGLPMIVEGSPGTGKSSEIEAICRENGLYTESVIASLREPSDFAGLPIPDGQNGVSFVPPSWARRLAHHSRSVGFLDEVNQATPAVQGALLRVVLDGVCGDFTMPASVRWLAAINPTAESSGGWDLTPALANRFGHLSWTMPSAGEWSSWLMESASQLGVEAKAQKVAAVLEGAGSKEEAVLAAWPKAWASVTGMVAGFLQHRPELMHKMPKAGDPQASKGWPSHRSWEMATRACTSALVHGLNGSETDAFVGAFIGHGAAAEFSTWCEKNDLPDPSQLLDGKITWDPDHRRLDMTVAVLSACAGLIIPENAPKRKERTDALWLILGKVSKTSADVAVPTVRTLIKKKLQMGSKPAVPVMASLHPFLVAAGVMTS